ncbi:MAG TPA: pyrroline-5-carboxylate reductase [Flavobacteriales bacterium]|nr:pyrroline-5-carboxylate reductase [Flavobacteriales bacterium]
MKVAIIGYGNLGKIYADVFCKYKLVEKGNLYILNRSRHAANGKGIFFTNEQVPEIEPDIVLLAVKPQDYTSVMETAARLKAKNTVYISVMAGITIETLKKTLGHNKIVRIMPNSPIEIEMGITGFTASGDISFEELKRVENLLSVTGRAIYFEDENMLNGVTALSGSGPAYFFYVVKNMIEAGKQMGFTESVSTILVKQTMAGALQLLNDKNKSIDELIATVASKGGTTFAAFEIFASFKMDEALIKGLKNAEKRAAELSNIQQNKV